MQEHTTIPPLCIYCHTPAILAVETFICDNDHSWVEMSMRDKEDMFRNFATDSATRAAIEAALAATDPTTKKNEQQQQLSETTTAIPEPGVCDKNDKKRKQQSTTKSTSTSKKKKIPQLL